MLKQKIEHFEVSGLSGFKTVELIKIKDFVKISEILKVYHVFITEKKVDEETNRAFNILNSDIIYNINSNGFISVDDFDDADDKGFENAEDYAEAKKGGYHNYKEFVEFRQSGVIDRNVYKKAQKTGFVDNYDDFKKKLELNKKTIPEDFDLSEYDNSLKLFQFANERGFKDYGDFAKGFFLGFTEKIMMDEAKDKGFTYAKDYIGAVSMGFDNIREFQEATHLNIKNKIEFKMFDKLRKISKNIHGFDGAQLIEALKIYENGKRLSIKKISELIEQEKEKCKQCTSEKGIKELPEWYDLKLNTNADIEQFLRTCTELKDYGFYDADGEFFEVSRLSDTTIYIDGSNVAYADNGNKKENKPQYLNIITLAQHLKELRYKDIIVIVDASLNHTVADPLYLSTLKQSVQYLEAPGNTSADEFLIENAKKNKCYIVTNDTFRDWKAKDSWIFENIDRIRVPFLRNSNGTFSTPSLDLIKE